MASKRKMVFGYRMEFGDIIPCPKEAETVRYIYAAYLTGASFQHLAKELGKKKTPYQTGKPWDKNMVSRILADSRYIGTEVYPALISAEQLQAVQERRKQKRTTPALTPAQIELRRLYGGAVPDSVAQKVLKILNQVVDDPQLINMMPSGICGTADIQQLQQELDGLLQTPPVDEVSARQKAMEITVRTLMSVEMEEYETHRLRSIFGQQAKMTELDAGLLRQWLCKVECQGDGVRVPLKNGQWLEA